MTTPNHIALLELLGWSFHQIEVQGVKDVAILPPGVSITNEGAVWTYCGIEIPPFDDSLLRTAREQLLTTEELWARFISGVINRSCMLNTHWNTETWLLSAFKLKQILSASPADQAAVLVAMFAKEKA